MTHPNLQATAKLDQWWKPKAANLLAVLYTVMLLTGPAPEKALQLFLPSVLTILGIGSFGHLLNDWFDIEADQKVGKSNRLANMPVRQRYGWLLGTLVIALLPWLVLPSDRFSFLLLFIEFALLSAYAIPPLRLKERKVWPLFIDGAYAYAVPAVLAAHTFFLAGETAADPLFLGLLFLWQLALGIRHFLNHLALDRLSDLATQTQTLATQRGNPFIHRLGRNWVLPVELVSFAGFLIVVGRYHLFLAGTVFGIWLFLSSFHFILALGRDYPLFAYRFSRMTLDWFYQDWWPLIPLFFLATGDWRYVLLVPIHLLLFSRLRGRFFFQGMAPPKTLVVRYLVYWPSLLLLSPFYFLNRLVTNRRSDPPIPDQKLRQASGTLPEKGAADTKNKVPIAVVNINKSKYTETFVWKLVPRLPFEVLYLHGGELPLFDDDDRHFLSNWISLHRWAGFLEIIFNLEQDYFLRQSITSYLQAKKVRLIYAQFGPVGAKMLPVARDLGIPLVVHFHGYDVFHREILTRNFDQYQILFREAQKIIGVSEGMLEHLHQLGAPREKMIHLPAYVDLGSFPYSDHAALPPRFLAVGRFAETKSPHLTLLAFREVLRHIPDATLTLVGKGGGGELYEACLILAKALEMENSVEFRGVLGPQEVAEAMRTTRIFVQHSLTTPENGDMEGKPVAIMEAMASGMPVVATRHSGIAELIDHGFSGLLIPEYDIEAMAEAMIRLAEDDELARRLGQNAAEAIRRDSLITDHIEILEGIIEGCLF